MVGFLSRWFGWTLLSFVLLALALSLAALLGANWDFGALDSLGSPEDPLRSWILPLALMGIVGGWMLARLSS